MFHSLKYQTHHKLNIFTAEASLNFAAGQEYVKSMFHLRQRTASCFTKSLYALSYYRLIFMWCCFLPLVVKIPLFWQTTAIQLQCSIPSSWRSSRESLKPWSNIRTYYSLIHCVTSLMSFRRMWFRIWASLLLPSLKCGPTTLIMLPVVDKKTIGLTKVRCICML